MRIKRHDEVYLISPERKTMTFNEFVEYTNKLPIDRQLRYRLISTKLDLSNEQEVVQEIEKGSPLEIYIGDRIPVQTQVEEQDENGMSMGM